MLDHCIDTIIKIEKIMISLVFNLDLVVVGNMNYEIKGG